MKKTYVQPKAKKIDFSYDEQVVATSQIEGVQQKHEDIYCHYQMNTNCQSVVHQNTVLCDVNLWTLRR